jgi:hypothetical protein
LTNRCFFFPTDCGRGKYRSWLEIPGFSCHWIAGISHPLYVNPLNYFSNFLIFFNAAGIFFPLSNISKLIEKGFFFFSNKPFIFCVCHDEMIFSCIPW